MEIRMEYQGVEGSLWMNEYLERQLERFERFLSPSSTVSIVLIHDPEKCVSFFDIQTGHSHFTFESSGADIFEAFSKTFDEAHRCLKRKHQKNHSSRKLLISDW